MIGFVCRRGRRQPLRDGRGGDADAAIKLRPLGPLGGRRAMWPDVAGPLSVARHPASACRNFRQRDRRQKQWRRFTVPARRAQCPGSGGAVGVTSALCFGRGQPRIRMGVVNAYDVAVPLGPPRCPPKQLLLRSLPEQYQLTPHKCLLFNG